VQCLVPSDTGHLVKTTFGVVDRAALQVGEHQHPPRPRGRGRCADSLDDLEGHAEVVTCLVGQVGPQAQFADTGVPGRDQRGNAGHFEGGQHAPRGGQGAVDVVAGLP
jgi:hypothetical protein